MKSVIIALIIGIITVFGSIAYTNHLDSVAEQMLSQNNIITKSVEAENFTEASKHTDELISFVREKRTLLDAVGNHQELDDIEKNLAELSVYTSEDSKTDALAICRALDFLIESLPRNFKMKIENIL